MKLIGGQAVIEGVLMKSDSHYAVSARTKNGKIISIKESLGSRPKFLKLPLIRGIIVLWDTLALGIKALTWSANQQLEKNEKITKTEMIYAFAISFGAAILFFIALPFFLTNIFLTQGILFNLLEGLLRILILFVYIISISRMQDIKTIFQYHGAEHMSVHCYESGKKLTVQNARKFSPIHPRCGTAFLVIVLILSVIIFSFIKSDSIFIRILYRILFIPVIASMSYEILKLSAKYSHNPIMKAIAYPGMLFQRFTTRTPSDKQIEVAINSLKKVI